MAEQMCSEVEQIGHLGQKGTDASVAIPSKPAIVIGNAIPFERRSKTFKVGKQMPTAMATTKISCLQSASNWLYVLVL